LLIWEKDSAQASALLYSKFSVWPRLFGPCPRNPRPKTNSLDSGSLNMFFLHLKRERCALLIDLVMFIFPFLLRAPELGDISE
jgi:hypothetical protein